MSNSARLPVLEFAILLVAFLLLGGCGRGKVDIDQSVQGRDAEEYYTRFFSQKEGTCDARDVQETYLSGTFVYTGDMNQAFPVSIDVILDADGGYRIYYTESPVPDYANGKGLVPVVVERPHPELDRWLMQAGHLYLQGFGVLDPVAKDDMSQLKLTIQYNLDGSQYTGLRGQVVTMQNLRGPARDASYKKLCPKAE